MFSTGISHGTQHIGGKMRSCLSGSAQADAALFERKKFTRCFGNIGNSGPAIVNWPAISSGAPPWSFACWLCIRAVGAANHYGTLLANGAGNGFWVFDTGTGYYMDFYNAGDNRASITVPRLKWFHYAFSMTSLGGSHYINGIPRGTTVSISLNTSVQLQLFSDVGGEFWSGYLSECYFWSGYSLTDLEIWELCSAKFTGQGLKFGPKTSLQRGFYLPFDDLSPGQSLQNSATYSSTLSPFAYTGDGSGRYVTNSSSSSTSEQGFDFYNIQDQSGNSINLGLPFENAQI